MYTLMKSLKSKRMVLEQAPTLIVSLGIAQVFYKFGAFLPECVAFLATWYLLDACVFFVRGLVKGR
jgi:hypothetical protein